MTLRGKEPIIGLRSRFSGTAGLLPERTEDKMARNKTDLTDERRSPAWVIASLAWPLFLEQILSTLVSYADTAMVGALGKAATAAVSISNSFVFLINGAVIALGVGMTAYVARSVGARDHEAARSYIRHAFVILLLIGLPLALMTVALHRKIPVWMGAEEAILPDACDYLLITSLFRIFTMAMMVLGSVFRGRGDTRTPLAVNICVNVINIVGNYLLINPVHTVTAFGLSVRVPGAGLGVRGAALSTGFSWLIGGLALAVLLFVKRDPTRLSLHDSFRPDGKLMLRVVSISIPAMLERICMSVSGIVVTRCIATLGTTVVAANTVYVTAESISFMPGFAFATAATTLVGQALGAGKPQLAVRFTRYTNLIGAAILTAAGAMLYAFARPLASLFTPDTDVIDIAEECLHIVALIQPVQVVAWIYAGALRGAGDTRWPFYITAVCSWGIRAFGAFLCITQWGMGLPQACVCMCLDSLARCVLMAWRFATGKWKYAIREKGAA